MYEFVRTETGWVVYWGPNPAAEAEAEVAASAVPSPGAPEGAGTAVVPAGRDTGADALGPMAV
jgi:hypothetical protein